MLSNYKTMDINILLGIVNMKLRNEQLTIEELCTVYQLEQQQLLQRFEDVELTYNDVQRQFKQR